MDKLQKQVAPRSARTLLYDLAGRELQVQLHVDSGQTFTGRVLAVGSEGQQETVVLAQDRSGQVTYLSVAVICGITMGLNAAALPVVTGGKVQTQAQLDPLSRLAFQRRVADLEARFLSELGRPLTVRCDAALSEMRDGLGPIIASIESLAEVILSLRTDELGQAAIAKIQSLSLEVAERSSVAMQGDGLRVQIAGQVNADAWRPLVEAAL